MNLLRVLLNPLVAGPTVWLAALIWRGLYLYQLANTPLFASPIGPNAVFAAQAVSAWNWTEWPPLGPLYGFVLALGQYLPGEAYGGLKLVQALIGSLNCLLVWRLGSALFGPKVGLVAGLMAAFYVPSLYWEGQLDPAIWASTCALAGMALLGLGQIRPLLAGLFLGLAAGLESQALFLALVAILWLVWGPRDRRAQSAPLAVGCLLGFLPALWHSENWRWLLSLPTPKEWPLALYRFWHGSEMTRQADPYLSIEQTSAAHLLGSQGLAFPFGLVGPLALLGLYQVWRQHQRGSSPMLLLWSSAAGMVGAVLLGGDAGARTLVLPILLIMAALGGATWLGLWPDRNRWGLQAVFMVVLLLACNSGSGPLEGTATRRYWRGYAFEQQGMKANALREYEHALALGEGSPAVYGAMGRLYYQEQELSRAIIAYEELLRLEPDRQQIRADLAQAYLLAERPRQAAVLYEELQQNESDLFGGRLGDARLMAGDTQGALQAYKNMSTVHPDSSRVLYNLARLYATEGFSTEAVEAFVRLAQYPQWTVEASWRAAALLTEPGQRARAEKLLQTALGVEADNRPALWELGRLLVLAERYAEALPIFEKLHGQDPEDYRIYFFLSKTYYHLERPAEAEEAYAKYQVKKRRTEVQQSVEENVDLMLRQFGELGE